jgi:hypothetical protein
MSSADPWHLRRVVRDPRQFRGGSLDEAGRWMTCAVVPQCSGGGYRGPDHCDCDIVTAQELRDMGIEYAFDLSRDQGGTVRYNLRRTVLAYRLLRLSAVERGAMTGDVEGMINGLEVTR